MEASEIFRKTFREILRKKPRGTQSKIADDLKIARTTMSDYLKGRQPFSESKREQIAEYLGYRYEDFLVMGRKLFDKPSQEKEPSTPVEPMDRAVEILRLAEEKAGKKLNAKQREAVAKIIRKELKRRETEAMGTVVDMIKALQ